MLVDKTGKIYFEDEFVEELVDRGFDIQDIANIFKDEEYQRELWIDWEKHSDNWELIADGHLQNMQTAANELEAIAEKLNSGRGLTKAQAASNIYNIISNYLKG